MKKRWKGLLAGLVALLALLVFALPSLAASENVQAVLSQLEYLQRVDIDPEWPPDVKGGERTIQTLLDMYLVCSETERAEFTIAQNSEMRAYFEGLYTGQGKTAASVEDIFEGKVTVSRSPSVASSSRGGSSSSKLAASAPASSRASSVLTADSRAVVSSGVASSRAISSAFSAVSSSQNSAPASLASAVSSSPPPVSQSVAAVGGVSSASVPPENSMPMAANPPQIPKGEESFGFMGSGALATPLLLILGALSVLVFFRFLGAMRHAVHTRKNPKKNRKSENEQDTSLYPHANESANSATSPPFSEEWPDVGIPAVAPLHSPENANPRQKTPPIKPSPAPKTSALQEEYAPQQNHGASAPKSFSAAPMDGKSGSHKGKKTARTGRPGKMVFRQGDPDDIDAIDD